MRYLIAVIALAPFIVMPSATVTRRAQVGSCCSPTALGNPTSERPDRARVPGDVPTLSPEAG